MSRGRAGPTLTANALIAEYYAQRADAGLIITEGTHTSKMGRGFYHTPEIFTEGHAKGWRLTTDLVHERGGVIFCQLWHAGRNSHSSFRDGEPEYEGKDKLSVAPSAIKKATESGKMMYTPGGSVVDVETPREITLEEIKKLPEEYANCARLAKEAGFDGVEVHAGNGFLLDTFLQSSTNKRTDEYGGSIENRFKILDEVLKAVFRHIEPDRVGIRISPNGAYNGMGSEDNREAFTYYLNRLSDYGLAYVHTLDGLAFGFHGIGEPMTLKEMKDAYGGLMMGNCDYTAETAEERLSKNEGDLISFGRPFLRNPDLVDKFETGEEILPCLPHNYWYSSVDQVWTTEGFTDLSVVKDEESKEPSA
ncbi:flavin oxidoreductase/NADH oxidase [Gracilaria domingensis]|nr:flavin oxidoreductase/NADH oxidase [Gracilaria domingensis]